MTKLPCNFFKLLNYFLNGFWKGLVLFKGRYSLTEHLTRIWHESDRSLMGIWQESDGNLMGIWWEADEILMGIWYGHRKLTGVWGESDRNLTGIWQGSDGNLTKIWHELDKNLTGIWWVLPLYTMPHLFFWLLFLKTSVIYFEWPLSLDPTFEINLLYL